MTDKQLLNALLRAERHLKNTEQGYKSFAEDGKGSEWKAGLAALDLVQAELRKRLAADKLVVPQLGPVFRGGKSVLDHDLTHMTSGLGWPAFDDAFREGVEIIAPEDLVVTKASSSRPGDAFYARGASKIEWWFGHLRVAPSVGRKFKKGDVMGVVGANNIGGGPHVHVALDARPLIGKHLESHTNYTHGAPLIGVQLRRALERR